MQSLPHQENSSNQGNRNQMNTSLTISQLTQRYMDELDRADTTRRMYGYCIQLFYRWMATTGRNADSPTRTDIMAYKTNLKQQSKSPYTVDLYMNALKSYFKWLELSGISDNITTHIRNEKKSEDICHKPLTVEQVNHFIESIPATGIINTRDRLIIHLLYYNGLRVIESARLNIGDVDIQNKTMKITGKGRTSKQTVPINDEVVTAVCDYIQERIDKGYQCSPGEPLIIAHAHNRHKVATRLKNKNITEIVSERLTKAGIKQPDITPHSLRHSAAVHTIDSGKDLYDVTIFLRHTSTNTARIYTRYAETNKIKTGSTTMSLMDKIRSIRTPLAN
jgi:integrase/recombinase XerD